MMDKSRLSPCGACGKMISKNLVSRDKHGGSYATDTIRSGSCPYCGEGKPHQPKLEFELEFERREQELKLGAYQQEAQRKFDEENNEANRRDLGLWDLLKWGGIILVGYMVLRVFI